MVTSQVESGVGGGERIRVGLYIWKIQSVGKRGVFLHTTVHIEQTHLLTLGT